MTYPTFIEIDGKRVLWREIVQRRPEQLKAAAKAVQAALFVLRDDTRPACERTAARRYLETPIIEALALLFGRDRMVRPLNEHDFFGGDPQSTDRIRLIATIIDFEGDSVAEFPEWFRDDRGVRKWWNPSTGPRPNIRVTNRHLDYLSGKRVVMSNLKRP